MKKGSGVLVLPYQRTLSHCINYIRPQRGFNDQLIDELTQKTKEFSDLEKFVPSTKWKYKMICCGIKIL